MPRIPIIMPQLGESIAEATVVSIPFKVGDLIESDQDILEVETNKATMGVTTPCRGRVSEVLVDLQQSYAVGATLAYLEVTDEEAIRAGLDTPTPAATNGETRAVSTHGSEKKTQGVEPTVR